MPFDRPHAHAATAAYLALQRFTGEGVFMYELHLSRILDDPTLRALLAQCIGCNDDDVRLIERINSPQQFDGCKVLAQRWNRGGDFPQTVSILKTINNVDWTSLTERVCEAADCRALVSDDRPNPFSWIEFDGNGNRVSVHVDVHALDEREELRLTDSRES